jgi:hypothetical protein
MQCLWQPDHKKTQDQMFFNHHNNDIIQADSIPTVQNKNILEESQATVTNPQPLI